LRERIELLRGQVSFGPVEPSGYRVTIQVKVATAIDSGPSPKVEGSAYEPAHSRIDS